MMPPTFTTLARPAEGRVRERGSVFLAYAAPVRSEEEARAVLGERERLHPDATHHCSAWALRGGVRRANDGGEPSGSAGAPILGAITGTGLTDCAVVVTRWFGGTRLGVGGLARAYAAAAAAALAAAPRREGIAAVRVSVRHPYARTAAVVRALERAGALAVEHGYAAAGETAEVHASVPEAGVAQLEAALAESTAGEARIERGDRVVVHRNASP
jgi:putative IMPACT (imprinted ancient) family translation regulator